MLNYFKFSIVAGFCLAAFGCGASSNDKGTSTNGSGTTLTWAADISPIVDAKCSASGCHGKTGANSTVYQNSETAFVASKANTVKRLNLASTDSLYMPQGTEISTADKNKLLDFLAQQK
jgi:hypothetical protein